MTYLSNLSGAELIALANLVAIFLSQDKTIEELTILSTFLTSVADNLALLASSNFSENPDS